MIVEQNMIDHVSVGVTDLERSRPFYDAILVPLGYRRVHDTPTGSGYGTDRDHDHFYLFQFVVEDDGIVRRGHHLAFIAPDRAAVDAFHRAAIAAGATDDGEPGLYEKYHANYYAAFVIDPDRNRLEAVCHRSEEELKARPPNR